MVERICPLLLGQSVRMLPDRTRLRKDPSRRKLPEYTAETAFLTLGLPRSFSRYWRKPSMLNLQLIRSRATTARNHRICCVQSLGKTRVRIKTLSRKPASHEALVSLAFEARYDTHRVVGSNCGDSPSSGRRVLGH